ncbi:Uncharacterised protein [Citrobacter amalonaticus]|uniref:Uncharacterized protein n=1 Tax=Citrobacter amalonaticus TaxID=35703 RepID=A0A6N2UT57_CITAM
MASTSININMFLCNSLHFNRTIYSLSTAVDFHIIRARLQNRGQYFVGYCPLLIFRFI